MSQTSHAKLATVEAPLAADQLQLAGFWGERLTRSYENWMLHVSDDLLLSGYRQKPGIQAYIGEHIGKYLLSAIPFSQLLNSQPLRDKVKFLAESLAALQEPDGYLGTHEPGKRWFGIKDDIKHGGTIDLNSDVWGGADVFDVWSHKYCVLALLAYYQASGWVPALEAAIKATDLVVQIFGPGGRNINDSDFEVGLVSGSFLEPLMLLYQVTGYPRYLDFARHMLKGWEDPAGPRVLTVLRGLGDVVAVGKGKAYDMMSCFVGLVEFARVTGDQETLQLVVHARDQIADGHRYVTGGMSNLEYFWRSGLFPEWTNMETCVTFTWIQLNLRLHELTGDARCLDLVEEAAWNQLLPGLSPTGDTWSYFMSMTGPKRFFRKWLAGVQSSDLIQGAPITCCHTNGQRGLALVPLHAYTLRPDGAVSVNFYGASAATLTLPNGAKLHIEQRTDFPFGEAVTFDFTPETNDLYRVHFRVPRWTQEMRLQGRAASKEVPAVALDLRGQQAVQVNFIFAPRIIWSGYEARGKCSVAYGPIIFALDQAPESVSLDSVVLDLGRGDILRRLAVSHENGRPVIRVPARQIPALAAFDPTQWPIGDVELVPILFAGLKDNPGLTKVLDGEGNQWYNQEKAPTTLFPEYRVLLPFLWYPE